MDTLKVPGSRDITRSPIRSISLENLSRLGAPKHEKNLFGPSLSPPGHIFRGLRKKLGLKFSRSNQDVTASGTAEESKKFLRAQLSSGFIGMDKKLREEKSRSSLKLDGRKRSRTTTDNNHNGHVPVALHEQLSVQSSLGDGANGRPRSITGDSNDQFLLVDTISIDDSVDGNASAYDIWDDADGGPPDNERASQEIEKLKLKIKKTRQHLVEMQNTKAENVQEFLESANQKNKVNFEKRQQKTNANIQQVQRKLDKYQKMLKEYEERGVSQHRAKEMFRGMHDAVKAGASSISGAVTKPIESMNKLIKKERRSGSADNLGDGSSMNVDETEHSYLNSCSDDDTSSISSTTNLPLNTSGSINAQSIHTQSIGSELEKIQNQNNEILLLRKENEELKETVYKLKLQASGALQTLKKNTATCIVSNLFDIQKEQISDIFNTMNYERFRVEDLQGQFRDLVNQYNDLTELHQQEVMEVKEELYKATDRIECVDYRSAERAGEIEEAVDSCVTRIYKMELQQQHQQQMLLSVDGYFDGSGTAKVLLSKVLSLIIRLFAIVLVVVSLIARIITPFVSTWKRALISISCLVTLFLLWRNADKPLLKQLNHQLSDVALVVYEKIRTKTRFFKEARTAKR